MFTISNRSSNSIAITTAWSLKDKQNEHLYHAKLVRSFIKIDNNLIIRTYEWVVNKDGDANFSFTVPLCFGFRNRNCEIIKDEVVLPDGEIFNIADTEVEFFGDGFVEKPEQEPLMVSYKTVEKNGMTDFELI